MAGVLDVAQRGAVESESRRAHADSRYEGSFEGFLSAIVGRTSGEREVKAGNDLYSIGEPCDAIHVVVSGWVVVYDLLPDGRRQILHFALPGALLGFDPDPGAVSTFGAEALTDTVVCTMAYSALSSLVREHPEIGMWFAESIARDRNLSFDHLTTIGRRCARERVARLLLELFIRYHSQWPGHRTKETHLPLTQEHIADATGLTCVHVNRVLGDLRDEGIVQFHYRKLVILDPERLVQVAGIDPHSASAWIPRNLIGEVSLASGAEVEVADSA